MKTSNPLDGFTVDRETIAYVGQDLQRPECILAERDGTLWAADARGGVTRIADDGSQQFISQQADARFAASQPSDAPRAVEARPTRSSLPNGMAFASNGDILIANFGTDRLQVMTRDGRTRTLYDHIDGLPIGKVNFVLRDSKNRLWLTVSTRVNPWTKAAASRVSDGFIAVVDERGLRVLADGIYFTNEIRFDAKEEWLYVVETTGPCISRMRLDESTGAVALRDREVFGPSHLGGYPDGIAFDAYGNLWCTLIMVDQLIALTPQGDKRVLLDDGHPEASRVLREKMDDGTATPADMQRAKGTVAPWMTSITFGGPDLRTAYLGSLLGTRIPMFRSPVAGLPMVHWNESF